MLSTLSAILLTLSTLSWGQVCKETRNPTTGLGEMTTPWNSRIYSLYGQHMDPSDQESVQKWLTAKVPNGNFAQLARMILRKHSTILAQKRQELKIINELHRDKKISWIGVELSPRDLDLFKYQLTEQAQALGALLEQKGLSKSESDDMALLIYDSGHYFVAHRPSGSAPLHLIGLEEEEAYSASLDGAARLSEAREAIASRSKALKIPTSALSDFDQEVSEILGANKRGPASVLRKSQKRVVARVPSSEGKALLRQGFQAANEFVQVSLGRDEKISTQVWKNAQTSGLFIYGRAHQPGVSETLTKFCRRKI